MMLASRSEDTTTSTFLDDQGDFILPPGDQVGVTAYSNLPPIDAVMPELDLVSTGSATNPAVDEQTAEEVVRNLLNVSNELTGVTLAVMEGTSSGSAVGAAGPEGVDQSLGSEDRVRLALDRLRDRSRDRSRVVAQASDMQRRQVSRFELDEAGSLLVLILVKMLDSGPGFDYRPAKSRSRSNRFASATPS